MNNEVPFSMSGRVPVVVRREARNALVVTLRLELLRSPLARASREALNAPPEQILLQAIHKLRGLTPL